MVNTEEKVLNIQGLHPPHRDRMRRDRGFAGLDTTGESVLPEQWEVWAEVEWDGILTGAAQEAGRPRTHFYWAGMNFYEGKGP